MKNNNQNQNLMQNQYSFLFKYIIIGDSSVGKSCILMQFLQGKFKQDLQTTIGVQFGSKFIQSDAEKLKLQIWDTAGQQAFKSITRSYYRGSIGAILVYDITNRHTFNNLAKWIEQTKNYANEKLTIILVGNKTDLQHKRVVSYSQGKQFAEKHKMLFFESSAKNDTTKIFSDLSNEVLRKINSGDIDPTNANIGVKMGGYKFNKLSKETKKKSSWC